MATFVGVAVTASCGASSVLASTERSHGAGADGPWHGTAPVLGDLVSVSSTLKSGGQLRGISAKRFNSMIAMLCPLETGTEPEA
jgi:hypothetical protein